MQPNQLGADQRRKFRSSHGDDVESGLDEDKVLDIAADFGVLANYSGTDFINYQFVKIIKIINISISDGSFSAK